MDGVEKTRLWVAVASVLIMLVALFILGLRGDATEPPTNGDTLGRFPGETVQDYQQRAAQSLADREPAESSYALLTFTKELDDAALAALLSQPEFPDFPRVNAVIVGSAAAIDLPEPTADATRISVIQQQLENHGLPVRAVAGLVVHAPTTQLQQAAQLPEIAAVEALPPDAIWGRFSVRVNPDYVSPAVVSDAFAGANPANTNLPLAK